MAAQVFCGEILDGLAFDFRNIPANLPPPVHSGLVGNAASGEHLLGPFRVKDLAKGIHQDSGVANLSDLDQVNERFDRFPLAEVVAEGLAIHEVIFFEPVIKKPLCHGRSSLVAARPPVIHRLPKSVDQEELARATLFDDFEFVLSSRLFS